jgi:chromosome segregation ATPase
MSLQSIKQQTPLNHHSLQKSAPASPRSNKCLRALGGISISATLIGAITAIAAVIIFAAAPLLMPLIAFKAIVIGGSALLLMGAIMSLAFMCIMSKKRPKEQVLPLLPIEQQRMEQKLAEALTQKEQLETGMQSLQEQLQVKSQQLLELQGKRGVEQDIEQLQDQLGTKDQALKDLNSKLQDQGGRLDKALKQRESLEKECNEHAGENERLEGERVKVLKAQQLELQRKRGLEQEIEQLEGQLDAKEEQMLNSENKFNQVLQVLKSKHEEAIKNLNQANLVKFQQVEFQGKTDLEQEIKKLQDQLQDQGGRLAKALKQRESLEKECNEHAGENENLLGQMVKFKNQLLNVENLNKLQEMELELKENELSDLRKANQDGDNEINIVEPLNSELNIVQKKLDDMTVLYDALLIKQKVSDSQLTSLYKQRDNLSNSVSAYETKFGKLAQDTPLKQRPNSPGSLTRSFSSPRMSPGSQKGSQVNNTLK